MQKEKQTMTLRHQLQQVAPIYRVKSAKQETSYLEKRLEEKKCTNICNNSNKKFQQTVPIT